jgi:(2Fe-2S) ferredoxin
MGRRRKGAPAPDGCVVTVCRGCCCGTERTHPGHDHAGQLERLVRGVAGSGRVRTSDCLDACAESNVVVVGPSAPGRAAGARPVWLSGVLDPGTADEVVEWVRSGGPGVSDPPGLLDLAVFTPNRRARQEAGEL